jgi:hypothetical protein
MAKAELKTKATDQSVGKFIGEIADDKMREDCFSILNLMKALTKEEPKMWEAAWSDSDAIIINMKADARGSGSLPVSPRESKT